MFLIPESAQQAARSGPFFIVLNSASGHKDTNAEREVLADVFNSAGRLFEFLQFDNPQDIAGVSAHAVTLAKEKNGVVVAAGGDGTINAVAAAVLRSGCPFGVLPQGTFNYFGRTHAIPQDARAAATALLNASISPVTVGEVNGRVFLVEVFHGDESLADSVNHLLVVGFYLINFGYVSLALKIGYQVETVQASVEALSWKIGLVLLVLGCMHFFNLLIFGIIHKRPGNARRQPMAGSVVEA